MIWFLLADTWAEMRDAAGTVSAEKIEAFANEVKGQNPLTVNGSEAQINIFGVLTSKPSYYARYYGGGNTTYSDITAAVQAADSDPRVKKITLFVDSPGGELTGLFETMDAIRAIKKPVKTIALGTMASAAYGIGAQASAGVYAKSRASMIGSVGIAYRAFVYDDEVNIASTEAPKKRPDLKTEEGKAVVREELDALHGLFAEGIAAGRGVTVEKVNSDFGRGAVLLADDAKKAGMIDGILKKSVNNGGKKAMSDDIKTVKELKAAYPGLCEELVKEGEAQERDRVTAHLTMGKAFEAMDTALEAVENGAGMTATIQAKYQTAKVNKADRDDRTADANDTAEQTAGVKPGEDSDESNQVVAGVLGKLGLEVK